MHAAALRAEIRFPNSHSLKEKRRRMRMVMSRLEKLGVSTAEVDFHDTWQRSSVGVAVVAPQFGQLQRLLHSVERSLQSHPDIELLEVFISHLGRPE